MPAPPTGVLFYDATAQPLSTIGATQPGAYYQFYTTGTTTLANVYADGTLTTPLSQTPGIGGTTANSAGKLPAIYLNPATTYRYRLYTSNNVLIADVDPFIPASTPTQASIGIALYPQTQAEITAGVTPTNYAYPTGDVRRYGADPTGAVDSTIAINNALASSLYVTLPVGTFLISSSLIYQNNSYITGSGYLNTTIKGDLANASFFRSSYGEIPSSGNRPLGVTITNLCIFPKTAATITTGSVGINFRNAQYCSAVGLLLQYTDVGLVTDQNGQFLRFERIHAQVHNTAFWSNATIGGNNCISDCSFGGNNVALDIDGGAWDISKCDCSAILGSTAYCVRLGRPGGGSTVVHADKLYIEGLNSGTITMQIENSVNRSRVSMHRHSVLGTIVNNASEACMIEVPGQGYFNPVYKAQRVAFASAIDGTELAGLKSTGGNTLGARNSNDTDYAAFYVSTLIHKQVAITYSTSMTPDASQGESQIITANSATAFTINNPVNGLTAGQRLTIRIKNTSGGALGAVTWGANYKMSTWTQPANGFSRSIEFEFDGTASWVQVSQTGVDIPN